MKNRADYRKDHYHEANDRRAHYDSVGLSHRVLNMNPKHPVSIKVRDYLLKHPKLQSVLMINHALGFAEKSQDKKTVSRFLSLQHMAGKLQRREIGGQYYYSLSTAIITKADIDALEPMRQNRRGQNLDLRATSPEPVKKSVATQRAQTVEEFLAAGGQKTVLPGPDFSNPSLRRRPT